MQPNYSKYCHMGQNTRANIEEFLCISMGGLFSGVPPIRRITLNHSTNGVVVVSPGKKHTCVGHFESLSKLVSHEPAIL